MTLKPDNFNKVKLKIRIRANKYQENRKQIFNAHFSKIVSNTKFSTLTLLILFCDEYLNKNCCNFSSMMRHHEHKVKAFSLYAWGAPLIIFTIALVLQLTTNTDIYSPNIGKKRCWFQGTPKNLLDLVDQ